MSFEPEFLEFMKDTLIVNKMSGYSDYGAVTYSTQSNSYICRIVRTHEAITMDDGAEKLIHSIVYLASTADPTFDPEDLFTFPDGSIPILYALSAYPDEDGAYHHIQLKFGKRTGRV